MLGGPVFHFELVRTARRRRTFALRFVFGLIVLGIVAASYLGEYGPEQMWTGARSLSLGESAQFGQALFAAMMAAQAALVLGLMPALAADAIASERQRKTLHYLLASRLTSAEIVMGKLGARLLNVAVYPVLALPILSLITLIGGVAPASLVLGYVAIASSAYFLAGMALVASVLARRPRDAVGATYSATAAWLFVPGLINGLLYFLPPPLAPVGEGVSTALEWVWPANPIELVTNAAARFGTGPDELRRFTLWMVASHAVHGTLLAALACWQLRPAFARQEARTVRPSRAARAARRLFLIRPCGEDPVFWKEAYFSALAGGFGRQSSRVTLFLLLVMAVSAAIVGFCFVFPELWENGYSGAWRGSGYERRMVLNIALRVGTALLNAIWLLWLGGATAAGITSEREQDTWTSLLATPLEGREIVLGKMLGPLRATAPTGVTIGVLWSIGLVAGAVHPLGFLHALVELTLLVWFTTALGTYVSLKSQTTWKARLWTQGILVAPHVCCFFPIPSALVLLGFSLWSYSDVSELMGSLGGLGSVFYFLWGMLVYGAAAALLTHAALRGFDAIADRPRRRLTR
jgi:ABC-type transport system involved in multi-copper enzyme maturation permease subunit